MRKNLGSVKTSPPKARPHGDYTRHTEVQRNDNGHTRNDTWTGTHGTATRDATVVNDRENRTRTRNVDWTGPRGQQASRTDVTQRTGNDYTRKGTATGPQCGTATRDLVARVPTQPAVGITRYKTCGLDGLYYRSKAPYRQANKLPFQVERAILGLKNETRRPELRLRL